MTRNGLSLLTLLVVVESATADYMMIRYDLNKILALASATSVKKDDKDARPVEIEPSTAPPAWIHAHFELPKAGKGERGYYFIDHPWGEKAYVLGEGGGVKDGARIFTAESRLREFERRKLNDSPLSVAAWTLQHGLLKKFRSVMDEFESANKDDPVAAAYRAIKKDLRRDPPPDPGHTFLKDLQKTGYRMHSRPGGHYILLEALNPNRPITKAEVEQRVDILENQFETYYYWFALQGIRLALPPYRLAVVLETTRFKERLLEWGSPALASNGFTPRRANVIILDANPRNEALAKLQTAVRQLIKKLVEDDKQVDDVADKLLSGAIWKERNVSQINPEFLYLLQSLVLVKKAMEQEEQLATLSYEGSRQLLAGSGLLPRGVRAPEWILHGLASFLETPTYAFHPGPALPNWTELVHFKYSRKHGQLNVPALAFRRTITDDIFREGKQLLAEGKAKKDAVLAEKGMDTLEMGRAASWSLVFYLVKTKQLKILENYCGMLRDLPRDMDYDPRVLDSIGQRAFGLRDDAGLTKLASSWCAEMDVLTLDLPQAEGELMRLRTNRVSAASEKQ
jgi:hypothetical protein